MLNKLSAIIQNLLDPTGTAAELAELRHENSGYAKLIQDQSQVIQTQDMFLRQSNERLFTQ